MQALINKSQALRNNPQITRNGAQALRNNSPITRNVAQLTKNKSLVTKNWPHELAKLTKWLSVRLRTKWF